jgi:hypothetical protein
MPPPIDRRGIFGIGFIPLLPGPNSPATVDRVDFRAANIKQANVVSRASRDPHGNCCFWIVGQLHR